MIEGRTYDLKPYDIVLVKHNDMHRLTVDNSKVYDRIIVYISPNFMNAYQTDTYDLNFCFQKAQAEHSNVLRIPSLEKALCSVPLYGWKNPFLTKDMPPNSTGRSYFWNL